MKTRAVQTSEAAARVTTTAARPLFAVVGFLVCVEFASGVLQGFYSPVWHDVALTLGIRPADVNWFEAAQLIVSALIVPVLARLGDLLGHRSVLLISTAVTALGSWVLAFSPSFATFLIGFALQGAYVVWLPMEVAIVHRRTAGDPRQAPLTRRAAGILVGALEVSVIIAALSSGALVGVIPLALQLSIPAIVVTLCFVVIWFGIERGAGTSRGGIDLAGLALITAAVGLLMAGLIVIRVDGPGSVVPWVLLAAGVAAFWPFVRHERRLDEPLVDVRLLADRRQWPVQLTAALIGMSVLGAQIPLATFARTDPSAAGYGLGASASFVGILTAVYVIFLAVGAVTLPLSTRLLGPRGALVAGAVLAGVGYTLWLPFHGSSLEAVVNMAVVGIGTGVLIPALPAAAAGAAPPNRTGVATGMTNMTKTLGGAVASAVFAIALASTGSIADPAGGAAPLAGYLTVWSVCAAAAFAAAVVLSRAKLQR